MQRALLSGRWVDAVEVEDADRSCRWASAPPPPAFPPQRVDRPARQVEALPGFDRHRRSDTAPPARPDDFPNCSAVAPGARPLNSRAPGSFCRMYHASLFKCAPACVRVLLVGVDLDRKVFAGIEELDQDRELPVAPTSGTSPCRSRPNSPTAQCSVRPASGPSMISALTHSPELSTTPGGKSKAPSSRRCVCRPGLVCRGPSGFFALPTFFPEVGAGT